MLEKGFFQKAHSERQKELYNQPLKHPEDRFLIYLLKKQMQKIQLEYRTISLYDQVSFKLRNKSLS